MREKRNKEELTLITLKLTKKEKKEFERLAKKYMDGNMSRLIRFCVLLGEEKILNEIKVIR